MSSARSCPRRERSSGRASIEVSAPWYRRGAMDRRLAEPGPFSFLRRRTFLKLGVGGLAAVGGGIGGLAALRGSAPRIEGLRILDAHEHRTFQSIARAQLPSGGAFAAGADELQLAAAFDAFLADEGPENQSDLKTALALVEYGPVVFERRLTTFSNLGEEARLAHWRSWGESDLVLRRQVATAFRKFILLVGFDHPAAWGAIGYPGPSLWGAPR
jgi:hypothetical protein